LNGTVTPDINNESEGEGEVEKENSNKYVGLGSSKAAREEEARNAEEKAKSGSKRAPGSFGTKLCHQADSVSCAMVEHAHKATAKASDTLHVENRPADAIRRAAVTIEVSEVEEMRQDGGQVSVEDLKRNKVLVTISGARNREQVKWIFENVCAAMKHNDQRSLPGHERIELYGEDQDASAQVHVDAFYDARTKARVQPSKTPRPATDIIAETFAEIRAAQRGTANNEHIAGEE